MYLRGQDRLCRIWVLMQTKQTHCFCVRGVLTNEQVWNAEMKLEFAAVRGTEWISQTVKHDNWGKKPGRAGNSDLRWSQRGEDGGRKAETTEPLPVAKVAETRLLRRINILHCDRKSLAQTEPIKIWAWIKIFEAPPLCCRELQLLDPSRKRDEECLILIHSQAREEMGGGYVGRRYWRSEDELSLFALRLV